MSGQTVWPIKITTVALSVLSWLPSLQILVCFGHIQSINEVTPLEVSIFQKIGQDGENILADQDRKATTSIPYFSRPGFKLLL